MLLENCYSPLFIVLKETKDVFGRIIQHLFQPDNVYLVASKSGKITSDHFRKWLRDVFFPNVGKNNLLLHSWSRHCTEAAGREKPDDKNIKLSNIPKDTTRKVQPLDVFGFRIWNNFVRHFSDSVILLDISLHIRNNIIKLQSLVHNQLSSPQYVNLFKYSWYKSGYIDNKPNEFVNPVDFSFGGSHAHCEVPGCKNTAIIKCSWRQKSLLKTCF